MMKLLLLLLLLLLQHNDKTNKGRKWVVEYDVKVKDVTIKIRLNINDVHT